MKVCGYGPRHELANAGEPIRSGRADDGPALAPSLKRAGSRACDRRHLSARRVHGLLAVREPDHALGGRADVGARSAATNEVVAEAHRQRRGKRSDRVQL